MARRRLAQAGGAARAAGQLVSITQGTGYRGNAAVPDRRNIARNALASVRRGSTAQPQPRQGGGDGRGRNIARTALRGARQGGGDGRGPAPAASSSPRGGGRPSTSSPAQRAVVARMSSSSNPAPRTPARASTSSGARYSPPPASGSASPAPRDRKGAAGNTKPKKYGATVEKLSSGKVNGEKLDRKKVAIALARFQASHKWARDAGNRAKAMKIAQRLVMRGDKAYVGKKSPIDVMPRGGPDRPPGAASSGFDAPPPQGRQVPEGRRGARPPVLTDAVWTSGMVRKTHRNNLSDAQIALIGRYLKSIGKGKALLDKKANHGTLSGGES